VFIITLAFGSAAGAAGTQYFEPAAHFIVSAPIVGGGLPAAVGCAS
jgi:hypothetical protein